MKIQHDVSYKLSVLGGTFFSILPNLKTEDVIITAILAIIGAFVSFVSTLVFRLVLKKLQHFFQK